MLYQYWVFINQLVTPARVVDIRGRLQEEVVRAQRRAHLHASKPVALTALEVTVVAFGHQSPHHSARQHLDACSMEVGALKLAPPTTATTW